MAKDEKKQEKATEKGNASAKGRSFLFGWFLGLVLGIVVGWWIRPPESFRIDELRAATEHKFMAAKAQSKVKLADFAEQLARKLREQQKKSSE